MIGIYKITSPSNKIYIGQSVNIKKRFRQHKNLNSNDSPKLRNSLLKYGSEKHDFEIIEECEVDKLNERERYWQDFHECIGINGLNCKTTSHDDKSGFLSQCTKDKISKSKIGVKLPQGAIDKIKKRMNTNHPMKGRRHSLDSKNRMSNSHKGSIMSEEAKIKRSTNILNRCPVYDLLCRINLSDSLKKVKKTKQWSSNISKSLKGSFKSVDIRMKISKALMGKMVGGLNGKSKMVLDLDSGFFYDSIVDFLRSKNCSRSYYKKHYENVTTLYIDNGK